MPRSCFSSPYSAALHSLSLNSSAVFPYAARLPPATSSPSIISNSDTSQHTSNSTLLIFFCICYLALLHVYHLITLIPTFTHIRAYVLDPCSVTFRSPPSCLHVHQLSPSIQLLLLSTTTIIPYSTVFRDINHSTSTPVVTPIKKFDSQINPLRCMDVTV